MKEVANQNEFERTVSQDAPQLVYFTGSWCEPCTSFSPIVDRAADTFKNLVGTVKVDVDTVPELTDEFKIRSVPTLLLFRKGKPVEGIAGLQSYAQVSNWLMRHLLVF